MSPRKVLLVGWDAADWKVIHPLLEAGKMPNLARFLGQGIHGNIATLQPCLSPMLWTSIATGKRPFKHGIHGFSEPDPVSGGIRPVTNLSRKTKAIWNMLNQQGMHTITVGWWPSNPAEPLSHGVMVSNDYQTAHGPPEPWPMKPGTVHPERLTETLKELRFHPSELEQQDLLAFMPGLQGLTQEELDKAAKEPRVQSLSKIIAHCTSIHSAATALMQNEPWDLMCVYYDAIDHFGHAFMSFHPPQRRGIDDWSYRLFNYVTEAGYRYHDAMLGTLLALAGEETTVILMSDHGFHPDDFRIHTPPREPAGPAAEHRQFGIFAAKGPDIRAGQRIYGTSLLDICPTLLHLFGLPIGQDMDGKVLHDLFQPQAARPVQTIPSWDGMPGDHGMHPPDKQISAADSKAALDQLVALGYIAEPNADLAKAREQTVRELDYNLAQAYIDGGIYTEAVALLERLYATWPMEHRFGFKLATCYSSQSRPADLRALVATITARRMEEAETAAAELKETLPADQAAAEAEAARIEAMSDAEKKIFYHDRRELLCKARPNLFSLRYLAATADFAEKNHLAALEKLEEIDSEYGARRNALVLRGEVLQRLQRLPEARAAFEEALVLDSEAPGPLLGLARVALAERDFLAAIAHAKASLDLLYFQPFAHYLSGIARYRMGDWELAEKDFLQCLHQAPLFTAAMRMLGQIAKFQRQDALAFGQYQIRQQYARRQLDELRRQKLSEQATLQSTSLRTGDDPEARPMPELLLRKEALAGIPESEIITIVSGLPRSGTSLMMQILADAGLPAFTDGRRSADESNQRGYYEHDKVASLLTTEDRSWLGEARGKSLKVVAPLLASLPLMLHPREPQAKRLQYRILFLERPMDEILQSQETMLQRLNQPLRQGADIAKAYLQQVRHAKNWITGQGIPALSIPYTELVHSPDTQLPAIAAFIHRPEKIDFMHAAIHPAMHRSRK